MAVTNTVDDQLTHPQAAGAVTGSPVMELVRVITLAAADDANSIHFIGDLPDTAVIIDIEAEGDAVAGASDLDVGLYDIDGTVIDKDCFVDGMNITSATGIPTGQLGLPVWKMMTAVAAANARRMVWEHAAHVNKVVPGVGETQKRAWYRLGLTANSDVSAAGTLVVRVRYQKTA